MILLILLPHQPLCRGMVGPMRCHQSVEQAPRNMLQKGVKNAK